MNGELFGKDAPVKLPEHRRFGAPPDDRLSGDEQRAMVARIRYPNVR